MENAPSPAPTPVEHPPSPPKEPRPWKWKCHECNCRHRLSCTRRCLNCGHTLCFAYEGDSKKTLRCIVSFDYSQWIKCTRWRRRIQEQRVSSMEDQANPPAEQTEDSEADESQNTGKKLSLKSMLLNGTYSCFDHCIFPGYCVRKLRGMQREQASSPSGAPPLRSASIKLKVPNLGKKRKLSRIMPRGHRSRGRHGFQKKPSPLSQVWQLESDISGDGDIMDIEEANVKGNPEMGNGGSRVNMST